VSNLDISSKFLSDLKEQRCERCGSKFWSLKSKETCGEYPCEPYSFIGSPPIREYDLDGFREEFLSFFERRGHGRVDRRPVVARWRDDIYLTIASIAAFQPHVTSGEAKPPSNPLTISQPCIRMVDLDEVGKTAKHLTSFEMMAHHAFNDDERVYWIDTTVELCQDFLTDIGADPKDVTYKKEVWYGGGNAGPCLEVVIGGLEVATLVFMNMMKTEEKGIEINGEKYAPMGREIVDTGYGLERFVWLSKGDETIYDSVHGKMLEFLGGRGPEFFRIADHAKTIAFMLGDGLVPSNSGAGYLGRLLIRRALRAIEEARVEMPLSELVLKQIILSKFPELNRDKSSIKEMLGIEEERYNKAKGRGKRIVANLIKEKKDLQKELLTLYDTHGIPPELVKDEAAKAGLKVEIPKDFYSRLASLKSAKTQEGVKKEKPEVMSEGLYYSPVKKFRAKVVKVDGTKVTLDRTAFYPEGGGQPSDRGWLVFDDEKIKVKKVLKEDAIIHEIAEKTELPEEVEGIVDWDWRMKMSRAHTATHIILYSCRELFGDHVWQMGAQKGLISRLDISHYKPITDDELGRIEEKANEVVRKNLPVIKKWMERNEAERRWKRLYQGGAVPGGTIRVVEIEGIDAHACAGTHVDGTGEIGYIKIINTERVQDGVIRLNFSAGEEGVKAARGEARILQETANELNTQLKHLPKTVKRLFDEWKERGKELEDLRRELVGLLSEKLIAEGQDYKGVKIIRYEGSTVDLLSQLGEELMRREKALCVLGAGGRLIVATNAGVDARVVASVGAEILEGSAGGKKEFAQGGGRRGKLEDALARCVEEGKRLIDGS